MAIKKSSTSQLSRLLSSPVSLSSLLIFLAVVIVGIVVYKQTVAQPSINETRGKEILTQIQSMRNSAEPSDSPTGSVSPSWAPRPSPSGTGIVTGNNACVLRCVLSKGGQYQRCKQSCVSASPSTQ